MKRLYTPWGEAVDKTCPLPEYPRPQLVRDSYLCLNGLWDYAVEDGDEHTRRSTGKTVYILDEPTTGLHIADVHRLIEVLQKLVDAGNTVIVIEHNLDLIKCADHIIDLGPEGGSAGGLIVAEGTPEEVAAVPESFTGQYLKPLLEKDKQLRAAEAEK